MAVDTEKDTGPIIDPDLWDKLTPVAEDIRVLLRSRIRDVNADMTRELPFEHIDAILSATVARSGTILELFTSSAFRSPNTKLYYVSGDTLARIDAKYHFGILTPLAWQDPLDERLRDKYKDYPKFKMQALVLGNGFVEILYDQDKKFKYFNPDFADYFYVADHWVHQTIAGPGDMTVSGLWVMGLISVNRFRRVAAERPGGPLRILVETTARNVLRDSTPLRYR
ncbi:MAG: hypothetical protein HY059_18575 [Proteobacteria bacterium]|nr:hypothetical protein [Pseudomonadota bacterium]